ncbi:MAG TPA: diguanylate cyclase [Burkholderiaceae bacterium]
MVGLLVGNLLLASLLVAIAVVTQQTGLGSVDWRPDVTALIVVIVILAALASWLLYVTWLREAEIAGRLLTQGLSYRTLLRTASDGIHVLDRQGRVTELSESFAAMLGRSRAELLGQAATTWDAKLDPATMNRWFQTFALGETHKFETLHRRADGSLIEVEVNCVAVNVDGRDLIYCAARDMSDLLRARRELQAALHEQQLMLNNDLIGIVKTRQLLTLWANPAMARIFGYQIEDFLDRPLRMLFPDDGAYQAFNDEALPALHNGGRFRKQLLALRKNGTPVWIDVSGMLLSEQPREALWLLADVTPIQESLQRAEYIAFHDPLTGLPNRLLLDDRLKQGLALAERDQRVLAVCFLDLDGFKKVNDALGHAAGDELLKEVARRLQQCLRAHDTVCRVGGDEFVLLLSSPQDDQTELGRVLERVRLDLAKPILLEGQHAAQVTASIGVAMFPRHGVQPEKLLENADRAMYQAKRDGRNRVCMYEDMASTQS